MLKLKGRLHTIHRDQSGFTFIELMIAIVILGFGILSIVALQVRTMSMNSTSKHQTEAYHWGSDRIERLMTTPYAPVPPAVSNDLSIGNHTDTQGVYRIDWTVSDNSANVANTKSVAVSVFWLGNVATPVASLNFTRIQDGFK